MLLSFMHNMGNMGTIQSMFILPLFDLFEARRSHKNYVLNAPKPDGSI